MTIKVYIFFRFHTEAVSVYYLSDCSGLVLCNRNIVYSSFLVKIFQLKIIFLFTVVGLFFCFLSAHKY